jgi:hypothetical protein
MNDGNQTKRVHALWFHLHKILENINSSRVTDIWLWEGAGLNGTEVDRIKG